MKKQILDKSFSFLWLVMMVLGSPHLYGACGPTINWHNLSDTGCGAGQTNPGITTDVVDSNIDVSGINAISGPIHVQALTCDILISVGADSTITASGNLCNGAAPVANPALYLYAATGQTITFSLVGSLLFTGSANGATPIDLLVTVSGPGRVILDLGDGADVSFTSNGVGGGGATFAIGLDTAPNSPLVEFVRQTPATFNSNEILVGAGSQIVFVANDVNATGTLSFDGGLGQSLLTIEPGGFFGLGVRLLTVPLSGNFTIGDIDFGLPAPAGSVAYFEILNSVGSLSALRIVNGNIGCPSYIFDPFCQGPSAETPGGFYFGPSGFLTVADLTYIDYIGTATNTCCTFTLLNDCLVTTTYQRLRNGSAFIVDGLPDNSTSSTIQFLGSSAIYFRSGVDKCGVVSDDFDDPNEDFTIDPALRTPSAGNIVFDVEGRLEVIGTPGFNSGLNILSLEVAPVGCPIVPGGTEAPVFPARTFARNADGSYRSYNNAAFLFNNRMDLFNTALIHTDENHLVYEKATLGQGLTSEPAYIGGDTYWLCAQPSVGSAKPGLGRPTVAFYNSNFDINTSMAATGVDWFIPNYSAGSNNSFFMFYANGFCIDNGYGRNMILGTGPCFDNGCYTSTDTSSQLNVFQESAQPVGTGQTLHFTATVNDACITEGIVGDISNQPSLHSVFLNNATNLSIGTFGLVGTDTSGNTFVLTTTPTVSIEGACFSFDSAGGRAFAPELSGSTGQGGIFVDTQGVFTLIPGLIANFGAMVTKSGNAVINLPQNGAFFAPHIGISQWNVNLTDPTQVVLVDTGVSLSDYTFDWGAAIKDYCCSNTQTSGCFIPYSVAGAALGVGPCPAVTGLNLTNLPEVRGSVQQFQVQRSRICDVMHLYVNGGYIRELVFLPGNDVGDAAVAFLVVNNNGSVGLNSAKKGLDSLDTGMFFGVNGVILTPEGDGTIVLNDDVIINNVCPIVTGTSFGLTGQNTLNITSILPHKLIIKSTGILDLRQFTTVDQVLEFSGQLSVVAEPGARIILGGGIINFTDQAQLYTQPVTDLPLLAGTVDDINFSPSILDPIRVRMSGTGQVVFADDSSMVVGPNSIFGIESFAGAVNTTALQFTLQDQSSIQIGSAELPGGAFQVGDTTPSIGEIHRTVSFNLTLDGEGALFQLDRSGFFGLGAGVADKEDAIPNNWAINCLSNVVSVTIAIPEGTFQSNQIVTGNNALASLFAIGGFISADFTFDPVSSVILGGGNMVSLTCTSTIPLSSINPTVTGFSGPQPFVAGSVPFASGIFASKPLLQDARKPQQPVIGLTPAGLFNYLSTPNALNTAVMASKRANIAREHIGLPTLGYVVGSTIVRQDTLNIRTNNAGVITSPERSLSIGAVGIVLDTTSFALINAQELNGAGA